MRSPFYWLVSQEVVQEMSCSLDIAYTAPVTLIIYWDLKLYVKQFKPNVI